MSSGTAPLTLGTRPQTARRALALRLFYSGSAAVLLLLMFVGFHAFYLHGRAYPGRELAPPIRTLLILHGAGMTAWVVFFLVQPLLILGRRHRAHRVLGSIAAVLALAVTVLGFRVGIESARIAPPDLRMWGMTVRQFMIVPLGSISLFAAFVGLGVWARRRPDLHRPMMLLATVAAMSAAIGRIDSLNALYAGTVWDRLFGPFFTTLLVGGALLTVRCLLTRSIERWFAAGYAALVLANLAMVHLAPTALWDTIAGALLG